MDELKSTKQKAENTAETNSVLDSWSSDGIKTPFTLESTSDSLYTDIDTIQRQPYSNFETFKGSAKLMLEDTTLGVMQRRADIDNARKTEDFLGRPLDNPMLTKEEANKRYQQYGVTFTKDIRQNEAELIAAKKIREQAQRARLQQTEGTFLSGASSLMGSFAGAMLDPINIATAFIPVTKVIPALKGLEAAGFWGRTAVRSLDGAVMNSLVEPLPLWMAGVDQRDYEMADSLFNVAAGGLFGAGIGAFADGVRLLGKGEKFNAGVASAIDFANNRGHENIVEFQKKNPAITSLAYDDLIELPTEKLRITEEGAGTVVRLAEDGPLSKVVGYGKDLDSAKVNLRKQLGALLDDDNIFSGYRIDDSIDNFYRAIEDAGHFEDATWLPKWLKALQKNAWKANLSFEEYIARETLNFTKFDKIVDRAGRSKAMQLKFGELSEDALEKAVEQGAKAIDAYAKIKEAFKVNAKRRTNYNTYISDLREKTYKQKERYNKFLIMNENAKLLKEKREGVKKQLDTVSDTTEQEKLTKQITDLDASIKDQELELNEIAKYDGIDSWKYDADNIAVLEAVRKRLEQDPRTFSDVKEQLYKQARDESGVTWDTSDSILDDLSIEEVNLADDARITTYLDEIETAIKDIKTEIDQGRLSREERLALGIDENGESIDMRKATKRIENMEELGKAAEDYAACRRMETA